MNTIIHRILFKLGFCKKEARKILLQAADSEEFYMCDRIKPILASQEHLNFRFAYYMYMHYMGAYGFKVKNFQEFIGRKYPGLVGYLRASDLYNPWMARPMDEHDYNLAMKAKNEFLRYLASKL